MFPGKLHTLGPMFRDERMVRWLWNGLSHFRLFQRYLDGEDIQPLLSEANGIGANVLRVFCMYAVGIGDFYPQRYPQYDAKMQDFISFVGSAGLRIEWVILAACQYVMPDVDDQRRFVNQVANRCRGWTNCFVSLGNEAPQNGWKPEHFTRPTGADAPLFSFGSGLSDQPPERRGDYLEWHGRRDWPKVFASAEDMWYVGQGITSDGVRYANQAPIVHDEPIGFAEADQPGRRSTDPDLARTLALSGLAFGSGATFHSDAGVNSVPMGPVQRRCAGAFFGEFRDR